LIFEPRELIDNLGRAATSPRVAKIIRDLNLTDIQDDPPFRRYVGSKVLGLCLLFNEDFLLDVQFFVKPTRTYRACAISLPYGLTRHMSQADVHDLLGAPDRTDSTYSKYLKEDGQVKLLIEYDDVGLIRYVSSSAAKIG